MGVKQAIPRPLARQPHGPQVREVANPRAFRHVFAGYHSCPRDSNRIAMAEFDCPDFATGHAGHRRLHFGHKKHSFLCNY